MDDHQEQQQDPHIRRQAAEAAKKFHEFEDKLKHLNLKGLDSQSAQRLGTTYIARKAEKQYLLGKHLDTPGHPMLDATFARSSGELQQIIACALQGDYLFVKIYLWELSEIERDEKLRRVLSRLSEVMDVDGPKFELPKPFAEKRQGGEIR